jgi:hypothetical protein
VVTIASTKSMVVDNHPLEMMYGHHCHLEWCVVTIASTKSMVMENHPLEMVHGHHCQ